MFPVLEVILVPEPKQVFFFAKTQPIKEHEGSVPLLLARCQCDLNI